MELKRLVINWCGIWRKERNESYLVFRFWWLYMDNRDRNLGGKLDSGKWEMVGFVLDRRFNVILFKWKYLVDDGFKYRGDIWVGYGKMV